MFPRLDYLEWIEGRPEAALHDLAASDLRGNRERGVMVPKTVASLPEPPAGLTVETLLASIYNVEPESVLVTAGASHANVAAAVAALERHDGNRILVEEPGYEPLVKTPQGFGATVDRFQRPADTDWALDPDRVRETIDTDTAMVSITNRHNPSGRLADRDTIGAVADVAGDAGSRLLVDEVYAPYGSGKSGPGQAFGGVTAAGLENTIITGSLTKFFGLSDLRIGWLIAEPDFIEQARTFLAHVPTVAGTTRAMAQRVLYEHDTIAEESRELCEHHADLLASFVADRPELSGPVFDGSSFAFLRHDLADGDAVAQAATREGVLVVPGRFFDDPNRVRVSLGRDRDAVQAALTALGSVFDAGV